MARHALLLVAIVVTGLAAANDLRTGHIPNWLTLGALAAAPVVHFVLGGPTAAGMSVLGAFACAVVPLVLYRAGAMFGGDVKLLIAVGAICRATVGIEAEFYAFVAAALWAPAVLAYEGKLLRVLGNTVMLVANPFLPAARRRTLSPEMMTTMRFGPAIFAGALAAALLHWRNP